MSRKRARSPSPTTSEALALEIFHSEKTHDRKSIFIAAFSVSLSAKALQALPEFRTASHRMSAWRKPSRQKSLVKTQILFDAGHDDDGEKYGGTRLKKVLEDMEVVGTVVVARWFGGEMLGPIRFTHIENCAREAIWKWQAATTEAKNEDTRKRQKAEEADSRSQMIETLRKRDQSIFVLRGLLADKTAKLNNSGAPVPPTPVKPTGYDNMPMDALNRMDRARDSTMTFILKQIDKVDEQLKEVESTAPAPEPASSSTVAATPKNDPFQEAEAVAHASGSKSTKEHENKTSQEAFGTPVEVSEDEFIELTTPQKKERYGTPIEVSEEEFIKLTTPQKKGRYGTPVELSAAEFDELTTPQKQKNAISGDFEDEAYVSFIKTPR